MAATKVSDVCNNLQKHRIKEEDMENYRENMSGNICMHSRKPVMAMEEKWEFKKEELEMESKKGKTQGESRLKEFNFEMGPVTEVTKHDVVFRIDEKKARAERKDNLGGSNMEPGLLQRNAPKPK
ncbi:hypothetical protein V6N12_048167 [Hibiscus sabdariffa]|uniref:Uncharacterized protein n=1 Tax=Hibiscus sabdariffa TaxID=183260 RepID=A0ABR2EK82_9ROSI